MEEVELQRNEGLIARTPATIKVISGDAEVWGVPFEEISLSQEAMDLLITSNHGAKLNIIGSNFIKINDPIPEWWHNLLEKIPDKTVMFIGKVDSGKSSSILYLANKLLLNGTRVSIIDSDIGQSDLGPPGVISSSNLRDPVYQMKLLDPEFMYFIGDKSPRGHLLQFLVGTWEAFRDVKEKTILINTTGFVDGAAARTLKKLKIELLQPDVIIFIERSEGELRHLIRSVPISAKAVNVRSPVRDLPKDKGYRSLCRKALYKKYLENGSRRTFDLRKVRIENTFLFTGDERREYAPFLSELMGSGVIWVEESADMLLILSEGYVERMKVKKLEDLMRKEVKCAPINVYKNLYVGLKLNGRCSGVGIMESFDPLDGKAEILTRYGGDVDSIIFGFIRLSEDGEELGMREVDSP
jgi:polynucleotide 5'-hydroxyl-kinase GRC3/NOL9